MPPRKNNGTAPQAQTAPRQGASGNRNQQQQAPDDFAQFFESDFKGEENFEIDSELLSEEFNETRQPTLPFGIVINSAPAGWIIPEDQLMKAGWFDIPPDNEFTTSTIPNKGTTVTGILMRDARMIVLAKTPLYIRWKSTQPEDIANSFIGYYEDMKDEYVKADMDACSDYAVLFLDAYNRPLHRVPIVFRVKNVALWTLLAATDQFYWKVEKVFAQITGMPFSNKSDRWRSLAVLEIAFEAQPAGTGNKTNLCCKTVYITQPNRENFGKLFLGNATNKALVWDSQDAVMGFGQSGPRALPAARPVEVLGPVEEPEVLQPARQVQSPPVQPPRQTQPPAQPPRPVPPNGNGNRQYQNPPMRSAQPADDFYSAEETKAANARFQELDDDDDFGKPGTSDDKEWETGTWTEDF